MTCTVGVVKNGKVWLGGDSYTERAGIAKFQKIGTKLIRRGPFLFGYAGGSGIAPALQYTLKLPKHFRGVTPDELFHQFVMSHLIPCFSDCNLLEGQADSKKFDGGLLVGFKGRLYEVDSSFGWDARPQYSAIGCATNLALGAFWVLGNDPTIKPARQCEVALEAAAAHDPHVAPPFYVEVCE